MSTVTPLKNDCHQLLCTSIGNLPSNRKYQGTTEAIGHTNSIGIVRNGESGARKGPEDPGKKRGRLRRGRASRKNVSQKEKAGGKTGLSSLKVLAEAGHYEKNLVDLNLRDVAARIRAP